MTGPTLRSRGMRNAAVAACLLLAPALRAQEPDPAAMRVDLAEADLSFELPLPLVAIDPAAPALYQGALREGLRDVARLELFVAPVPPGVTLDDAVTRAADVALDLLDGAEAGERAWTTPVAPREQHDGDAPRLGEGEFDDGRFAGRLVVRELGDRHVALFLHGDRNPVLAYADELRAAARGLGRSRVPHPGGLGEPLQDHSRGFALTPPFRSGANANGDAGDWILLQRPPAETALDAFFQVEPMADALAGAADRTLEEAAEQRRAELDRSTGGGAEVAVAPLAAGDFAAFRIDVVAPPGTDAREWPQRTREWIVQLDRHRVWIAAGSVPAEFPFFEQAFDAAVASMRRIERRPALRLDAEYRDSEHGFALRPPAHFVRAPGASHEALVTFVEADTLAPSNRLHVRALAAPDDLPALARARLAEEVAAGAVARTPEPVRKRFNRSAAAAFVVERDTPQGPIVASHAILAAPEGAFQLTLETAAADHALYEPVWSTVLLSFKTMPRTIAPELGERVLLAGADVSVRPPLSWRREGDAVAFVEEAEAGRTPARFEAGVAPEPPPNVLAGPGERYRAAMVAGLEASGAEHVRVEAATKRVHAGAVAFHYELAYTVAGRPMREVRMALPEAGRVPFARGIVEGPRFAAYEELLNSAVESLAPEARDAPDAGSDARSP